MKKVTSNLTDAFNHPFWMENSSGVSVAVHVPISVPCACLISGRNPGKTETVSLLDSCGFGLFTLHTRPNPVGSEPTVEATDHAQVLLYAGTE
jgi:hypothetical protein